MADVGRISSAYSLTAITNEPLDKHMKFCVDIDYLRAY
jgi:hypothetical protein